MNFGNYKDSAVKLCKRIQASFVQGSLKWQNKNYERLVFEQAKDPVIQRTKLYNYSEANFSFKSQHWSEMCIS